MTHSWRMTICAYYVFDNLNIMRLRRFIRFNSVSVDLFDLSFEIELQPGQPDEYIQTYFKT